MRWLADLWLDLTAQPRSLTEIIWLVRYCGDPRDWAQRRWDLRYWREHYGPGARLAP